MADVLPFIYSRGNALRRRMADMFSNPLAYGQQAAGQFMDTARETQGLNQLAFSNPRSPFEVTNQNALLRLIDNTMSGGMGMAPVGMARPSKAANTAAGLYHPIAPGQKLDKPFQEMRSTTVPDPAQPLVPRLTIHPEEMLGGSAIPFLGDRAAAGRILTHIDDKRLKNPVVLEGGPDYARANTVPGNPAASGVWASAPDKINPLSRMAREAAEQGRTPYGVYTAMSPTGVDFNTMVTDTLLGQLRPRALPKDLVERFNAEVRKTRPEFVGLMSPKLSDQLAGSGNLRKDFLDRMTLEDFRRGGFPDVAAARKAITEPALMDVPLGSSGYAISRIDPSGASTPTPLREHKTYKTQLTGQYAGSFDKQVPWDVMFPEFFNARRAANEAPRSDPRSFQMNAISQPLDQQWLDGVMRHLEMLERGGR